ncbi:mRNA-decapping enzyme-like protein isoform X2 [Tasmannia lanceolata]|uniref:mRNA-decapping enzyme-like protein isoform X2 n=1 Tax=Tasmannia lanceolata TaxID=3420 RepID=UPI00406361F5
MLQSGKLTPNLDHKSTKVLNLTVLQRIDPFIEEILITASHVALYQFNIELSQWSRKDVEGSLFVVKRNTQPRFQFIVMNRRSTDNLVENLLGDFEYDVQVPYLLYHNAAQEVNGIWFYNSNECEEVANLFTRILNAFSKIPPKPNASSSKSEFEELEAVPTLAVMEGPLDPSSSSALTVTDVSDDMFVNFFSAAMSMGSASNVAVTGQQHQSPAQQSLSFHAPSAIPLPALQIPSPLPMSRSPLIPLLDNPDSSTRSNHATNLAKHSSFFALPSSSALMMPPISSSMSTVPPVLPPVNLQRPYGTPMLQPLPPPAPPLSLTPTPTYGPVISRDRVRDALVRLAQNNHFIDIVYREMLNAHYS